MPTVNSIIKALDAFDPTQGFKGVLQLRNYFAGFRSLSGRERAIPAMLSLMERCPEADFGAPPFLVHEIENIPGYEPLLIQSLERRPFFDSVGMLKRILNSDPAPKDRALYLNVLEAAARHPLIDEESRDLAEEYLDTQAGQA